LNKSNERGDTGSNSSPTKLNCSGISSISTSPPQKILIGRPGPYPVEPEVRACSGKFTTTENVISQFSDRDMDPASTIGPKVGNANKKMIVDPTVNNFLTERTS
jgi:hypothetical protein